MKKLALTIAIVLGLSMTSFADPDGGGLFQRGAAPEQSEGVFRNGVPGLPGGGNHNLGPGNQNADPETPLGSGVVVLLGLGAAYMVGKKRREE